MAQGSDTLAQGSETLAQGLISLAGCYVHDKCLAATHSYYTHSPCLRILQHLQTAKSLPFFTRWSLQCCVQTLDMCCPPPHPPFQPSGVCIALLNLNWPFNAPPHFRRHHYK